MKDFNIIPQYIEVLIVANGDILPAKEMQMLVARAEHTIVCDGALEAFYSTTMHAPDLVIGDGDSVQQQLMDTLDLTLIQNPDQESNDLTKAVRFAESQNWTNIVIVGISGKREDHTIANISLLTTYFKIGMDVTAITPYGIFLPFTGELQLSLPLKTQISFFAFERLALSAYGVAYPFEQRIFDELWQATLNEVTEDPMTVHTEGTALIYIAFEDKYNR